MNFEGFADLMRRVAREWYDRAEAEHKADFRDIHDYLQHSPFTANQTDDNEAAYEKLMDVRMKLYELSHEIDLNHDTFMEFIEQTMDSPSLMDRVVSGLTKEEKHLVQLELMIMEQVADWEVGKKEEQGAIGSDWSKAKPLVVHLPNGSTRTISIGQQPERRYWFSMCPITSKLGATKLCSGCRSVGYLGRDEQKQDWPAHKQLCKILTKARREKSHWSLALTPEELGKLLVQSLGGRDLTQYETDLMAHGMRSCTECSAMDNEKRTLTECKNCHCVLFCPEHARKNVDGGGNNHAAYCKPLKICAEDYRNEVTLGHQVQVFCPRPATKLYKPLEGTSIESLFRQEAANIVSKKLPGYLESEVRYLTFLYTCPLSVLYGAEKACIGIENKELLTVHLVGVRRAEIRNLTGWEIIASRLPKLKELRLYFVGDEAEHLDLPAEFTYQGRHLQSERPQLRVRYFLEKRQLYQDFVLRPTLTKPDVVAALDCGFKFYGSWHEGMRAMTAWPAGSVVVFSEFTLEDLQDNLTLMKKLAPRAIEVALEPQKNPFRSTRPVRCSDRTGNYKFNSVIYTNDFICVIKTGQEKGKGGV